MDAMMLLSLVLLLFVVLIFVMLNNLHNLLILEALDTTGAALILDGRNLRFPDLVTAVVRRRIRVRLYEDVDSNVSLPCEAYESADSSHSPDPQDWEKLKDAALSATREVIRQFERVHGSDGAPLYPLIQTVTLSTILHLFFQLSTTSTNIEDVVWIVSNTWRTDGCWKEPIGNFHDLYRLVKPWPNPSGMFAVLSAIQRLILAAICTLEHQEENIQFIRRAGTLLRHPTDSDTYVTRLVEGVKRSNPPIQSVHGRLSLRCLPLPWPCDINFFIPIDSLPPSDCRIGPDGVCLSWLHKAALPGPPACGGDKWLVHATTIILSAVDTGLRNSQLIVDGDECGPEAWEEWVVRRLRVG